MEYFSQVLCNCLHHHHYKKKNIRQNIVWIVFTPFWCLMQLVTRLWFATPHPNLPLYIFTHTLQLTLQARIASICLPVCLMCAADVYWTHFVVVNHSYFGHSSERFLECVFGAHVFWYLTVAVRIIEKDTAHERDREEELWGGLEEGWIGTLCLRLIIWVWGFFGKRMGWFNIDLRCLSRTGNVKRSATEPNEWW